MAQFNEILEGGLNQVIVKRLGMQTGTAVPTVMPELTTDLVLENDRVEWGFLKGEYRFGRGVNFAAPAAGSHAALVLENQGASDMIVVVEGIYSNALLSVGIVSAQTYALLSADRGLRRDTRQPGESRVGVLAVTITTANLPARTSYCPPNIDYTQPFVLAPGNLLVAANATAANAMSAHLLWRERPGFPGELG